MSVIKAIREYIAGCPLLKDGAILGVDQLEADAISYTIDEVPGDPVIQKYVDGSSKRQFRFVFASREEYGERVLENLKNSGFYEDFADWIEANSWNGDLPELGEWRTPIRLEVLSGGYVMDAGDSTARYQIQLNLIYYQDRRYFNG